MTARPAAVREGIATEKLEDASLTPIAADLDGDGTPTAQGGRRWYPSTVGDVLTSAAGKVEQDVLKGFPPQPRLSSSSRISRSRR